MKVSIIIANYNYGPYLAETFTSVLDQSFQDFEVIVVDDGSTDHSRGVIEEFEPRFAGRLKAVFQQNSGPACARNAGIELARGDYLAFLDADDIWTKTTLEKTVGYLDRRPEVGLVYGNTEFFDSQSGKSLGFDHGQGSTKIAYEGRCADQLFVQGNFITLMTTLVRRAVLQSVGLFDSHFRVGEDVDLWMRIASQYDIGYIDEVLCRVRRHEKNLSFNSREAARNFIFGTRKILKLIPNFRSLVGEAAIQEKYYRACWLMGVDSILNGRNREGRRWLRKALKYNQGNIWKNKLWFYYGLSFVALGTPMRRLREGWHSCRQIPA